MKDWWQLKTLKQVCTLDKCHANHEQLPYVGLEHIEPETGRFLGSANPISVKSSTFKFQSAHLLYGRLRPYLNKVMLPEFEGHCSTEIFPLKPSDALSRKFLFYWFIRDEIVLKINATCTGARMPRANMNAVLDFEFTIPPLHEQQRIVGILDQAFEAISTAKASAEKNLQNARALFESYHYSVFSQLRNGWAETRLGDVCEYLNGKAHEQCIDEDGQFIVINSKFISSEGAIFKRSNHALLLLQPADITIVLSDVPNGKSLAKCFLVEEGNKYTLNQRICAIRSTHFYPKFLFYQLNRNRHFLAFDNGENQTNMRLNQVLSCPLFIPLMVEQKAITAELDTILGQTQRLESIYQRKIDALNELKQSLLHQAFSGEL